MYVLIPHIKIKSMSMLQTPSILTPLPVFATNMFAHAIGEQINSPVTGVGLIFHEAFPDVEHMPNTAGYYESELINKRGACGYLVAGEPYGGDYVSSAKTPDAMSYQPGATATVKISLLLNFEDGLSLEKIKSKLRGARIAGGSIQSYGRIQVFDGDLSEIYSKLPSGYIVLDASDVVQKRLNNGESIIDALMTKVIASGVKSENNVIEKGWYAPVTIGYSPITSYQKRAGSRDGLDHAFAEPVVGLVRLVSVGSIKRTKASPSLWRHRWTDDGAISIFNVYQ